MQIIKFLLENKADVNAQQQDGTTALHVAAKMGRTDIVELLLAWNADVNYFSGQGYSALHFAAEINSLDITKLLIAANADTKIRTKFSTSPWPNASAFEVAVMKGNFSIAMFLTEASEELQTVTGYNGIFKWARLCSSVDLFNFLIEKDSNFIKRINSELPESTYLNALCAIQINDFNTLQKLKNEFSLNLNQATPAGLTLLSKALKYQHLDMVDYLIEQGAKPDLRELKTILDFHQWTTIKMIFDTFSANSLEFSAEVKEVFKDVKTMAEEDIKCPLPPTQSSAIINLFEQHQTLLQQLDALNQNSAKHKIPFIFFEEKSAKKQKTEHDSLSERNTLSYPS